MYKLAWRLIICLSILLEMTNIYNSAQVRWTLWVLAIPLNQDFSDFIYQSILQTTNKEITNEIVHWY